MIERYTFIPTDEGPVRVLVQRVRARLRTQPTPGGPTESARHVVLLLRRFRDRGRYRDAIPEWSFLRQHDGTRYTDPFRAPTGWSAPMASHVPGSIPGLVVSTRGDIVR